MELLVVRHAVAAPAARASEDEERALTEKGRARFALTVDTLERMDLLPEIVVTSPWRRARETADLIAEAARCPVRESERMCHAPGSGLLDALGAAGGERIAVVGHQPWLSELILMLAIGNEAMVPGSSLGLRKGGFALLRGALSPAGMQLRALVPPEAMG